MLSRPSRAAEPQPRPGPHPRPRPGRVIDIGSNSVRLVVYERLARSPTPLFNEKMLAGLGAGVAETGRLAADADGEDARPRSGALPRSPGRCASTELDVLATAATREAENGADFIAEVEAICGVPVTVLSGAEEARIAALGIVAGFQKPDGVAGDLGGGSLELTEVAGREVGAGDSLMLGGLRLQAASRRLAQGGARPGAQGARSLAGDRPAASAARSTRSAAPGARSRGSTCTTAAIRCTSCTNTGWTRTSSTIS